MAESSPRPEPTPSCPGLQAWHIRDENLLGGPSRAGQPPVPSLPSPLTGATARPLLSDGQRFRAGGRGESTGHVNPKYGSEPGGLFYTHISDQYAPFSTRVVNVGVRDSTYVLDGCCTTSPTYGLRSTTPTRLASPITSSP